MLNKDEKARINIERACGDIRRGMPVIITDGQQKIMVISPENTDFIDNFSKNKRLIISKTRAQYIFPNVDVTNKNAVSLDASELSNAQINNIAAVTTHKITQIYNLSEASILEERAVDLAKICELLPAIICCDFSEKTENLIEINIDEIASYTDNINYNIKEVCRAPLTLTHAKNAEIIAYRPSIGGAEHYAIIIESPGDEPIVRVHSSCYTGDLLASLTCDCRDQLHSAIELMSQQGGGIILYLLQDGRGIGLVNKLRTYILQSNGLDTMQANLELGFDDDARLFLPAAEILKKLKKNRIRLLTNNPKKAEGLSQYGINVVSCVPHIMQSNEHNENYLQTKKSQMGHKL